MRKKLNKQEVKLINDELGKKYGKEFFSRKDDVERADRFIVKNGIKLFFYKDERLIPTLRLVLEDNFLKKVTVDMGAVKFVISGADVMRPGITKFDEKIQKGEIVAVVDEKNSRPLAVGEMLFSGEEAERMKTGKVVKNLHHVGDGIWG